MRLRILLDALGIGALLLLVAAGAAQAVSFYAANLPQGNDFPTSVVLVNDGPAVETATLQDASGPVATLTIPAGGTAVYGLDDIFTQSELKAAGAYRIDASQHVHAAQAVLGAPLSNDASALLDDALLGTDHWILGLLPAPSEENCGDEPCRSFITVVATEPSTTVTVDVAVPTDPGPGVPLMVPGITSTFALGALEALNIEAGTDLSGSRIRSDRPVAVFAGAACTTFGAETCDHISEQIVPIEQADSEFVVCVNEPVRPGSYERIRVLAVGAGTTTVTTTPGPTLTLSGAGAIAEFDTSVDVHLDATGPVLVGSFYGLDGASGTYGDPASILVTPVAKHWASHVWHHPTGTPAWDHYVSIAAPVGASATLDGTAVSAPWRIVGASGFACTTQSVAPGTHRVAAAGVPIGVTAFGLAKQSSYASMPIGRSMAAVDWSCAGVGNDVLLQDGSQPASSIDRIEWDFGGSSATTAAGASHLRSFGPGLHTVSVLSVDAYGREHAAMTVVDASACNSPPAWDAVLSMETCARRAVSAFFDATDPDGDPLAISWDADPAAPGAEYGYGGWMWTPMEPGDHVFTFVAGDPFGASSTTSFTVRVKDCAPVPKPAPVSADADGDGVPDVHDSCGAVPNPVQVGGCEAAQAALESSIAHVAPDAGPDPPKDVGCAVTELLPHDVVANQTDHHATVTWRAPLHCVLDRFLVWNGTGADLIAVIPFEPGRSEYGAVDETAWASSHRYYVQAEAVPGPDRFVYVLAVPSGLVGNASCACLPEDDPVVHAPEDGRASARTTGAPVVFGGILAAAVGAWLLLGGLKVVLVKAFTRIAKDDLEDHPVRAAILDVVRAEPGIHDVELSRRLGKGRGAVRHHLGLLTAASLVRKESARGHVGYFPRDADADVRAATMALRSATARRLLETVAAQPGRNVTHLAEDLGVSDTSVKYHLKRLQRVGLVAVEGGRPRTSVRARPLARRMLGEAWPGEPHVVPRGADHGGAQGTLH